MTLAIDGGDKSIPSPLATGSRYGDDEKRQLNEAIDSQNLFYWGGSKTQAFCRQAAMHFAAKYCTATSSGTAAIHTAVATLGIAPGSEVITSPITDFGTLIGLLYQNLIPIFADVDGGTYNLTAKSIAARISPRTRCIIVVHLAGNPCEMAEIMELAQRHGLPVIEDCAQSYNAIHRGRKAGSFGRMGCFSLNGFKHISAGDGGFVITNDETAYFRTQDYADKCYDRHARGTRMTALAPCYRMTELQSAVAISQLRKLDAITAARSRLGTLLTSLIADVQGLSPPEIKPHNSSSYWFYLMRIDPGRFSVDRNRFVQALCAEGLAASAGYISRPMYLEPVFVGKSFFPGVWPAEIIAGRSYDYVQGLCPVAEQVLATSIRLPISEFFTEGDVRSIAGAIRKVARAYAA